MDNREYDELLENYREISLLTSVKGLLDWDQETYLPKDSIDKRAKQTSLLSGLIHRRISSVRVGKLIENLEGEADLSRDQRAIIREVKRVHRRAASVPESLVREMSKTTSLAQSKWSRARKKDDFDIFGPSLEKIISLKKEEAEYIGYPDRPYDALLDEYEPYTLTSDVAAVLDRLKIKMKPIVKKIIESGLVIDTTPIESGFETDKQEKFCRMILEDMGYDFNRGRLDRTVHPFTVGSDDDVRITTRYSDDLKVSLFSCIHEGGHALYEQGYLRENYNTPLAEPISLGIHESQSRMWENIIGRSLPFWEHYRETLTRHFPVLDRFTTSEIHNMFNVVKPSLIRVEADEVTYNMHILLRFEIENELFDGRMDAKEIPQEWNTRMEKYLGIETPDDRRGCLQDIHWSMGAIGYFPTYTLGNLYAAQFYESMRREIPQLDGRIGEGDLKTPLKWLRENIHRHGKRYTASELVEKVSREPLNEDHFVDYIREKYSSVYGLDL